MKLLVLIAVFAAAVLVGCTDERVAPTPSPAVPSELDAWLDAWLEWEALQNEASQRVNDLNDRVLKSDSDPQGFLDEYRELRDWYRGEDGPYNFVLRGTFPRFREVRHINDLISDYVERWLQWNDLYIEYLETRDKALFHQSDELLIRNNRDGRHIKSAVIDLVKNFVPEAFPEGSDLKGEYKYVLDSSPSSREARPITASIGKYVEQKLEEQILSVKYLDIADQALFDQSYALRIVNTVLQDEIRWAVNDLMAKYGLLD